MFTPSCTSQWGNPTYFASLPSSDRMQCEEDYVMHIDI